MCGNQPRLPSRRATTAALSLRRSKPYGEQGVGLVHAIERHNDPPCSCRLLCPDRQLIHTALFHLERSSGRGLDLYPPPRLHVPRGGPTPAGPSGRARRKRRHAGRTNPCLDTQNLNVPSAADSSMTGATCAPSPGSSQGSPTATSFGSASWAHAGPRPEAGATSDGTPSRLGPSVAATAPSPSRGGRSQVRWAHRSPSSLGGRTRQRRALAQQRWVPRVIRSLPVEAPPK